jgi:L-ascorbate metabolism protein UlaG (beta-lactamase superfamily)
VSKINITYIAHSGYVVELEKSILIFDYYEGSISNNIFDTKKNIIVFCTHSHHDHYNKQIFEWSSLNNNIIYVLSSDIIKNDFSNVYYMDKDDSIEVKNVKVSTFESTDLGVAFLVETEETGIFHAGDLNYWHWKDESTDEYVISSKVEYENILKKIVGTHIDIAMFPTDPRMGKDYFEGSAIFIEKIKPKIFFPMHFDEQVENLSDFSTEMKLNHADVSVIIPTKKGDKFEF